MDASSVGLGCILGDLQDNVDEVGIYLILVIVISSIEKSSLLVVQPTSETVCKNFGENGRLVEVSGSCVLGICSCKTERWDCRGL